MTTDLAHRNSALEILRTLEQAGVLTDTSFDLPTADLPYESYELIGRWLGKVRDTSAFWLADWLTFGEHIYGESYSQAVEATGRSKSTLANYAYVGSHVKRGVRRGDLSFSHHAEVAKLEPNDQRHWLKLAADGGWSVETLRLELRENGHGPAERPAWSERERIAREQRLGRLLGEVVEAVADPNPELLTLRMPEIAERARELLAEVPDIGKRAVKCPSCGIEFEED